MCPFARLFRLGRSRSARAATALVALSGLAGLASPRVATSTKEFDGQAVFRYDTFGDEQLWTDKLRLHEVIESALSPVVALGVGLKVDADALPSDFLATHDLNSPGHDGRADPARRRRRHQGQGRWATA